MFEYFRADELHEVEEKLVAYGGAVGLGFVACERDRSALLAESRPTILVCELELDLPSASSMQATAIAFSSLERRALYRTVRSVKGIGRSSALAVLNCGEVNDTLLAVAGKDQSYFKPVPGLGPKRAEAVIAALRKRYAGFIPKPIDAPVAMLVEARDALVADGAQADVAEARLIEALSLAVKPPKNAEAWLRLLAAHGE